jgi:GT2 family glycosyltransferase
LLRTSVLSSIAGSPETPAPVLRAAWLPGVSVLIPERGAPELLERALAGLRPALEGITEAVEIIVVVNGALAAQYAGLQTRFPQVLWQFHEAPLGFSGALARGLAAVRYGGVYLHNSDMVLEPDTLTQLLPWRAPHVFALASQIFFDNPNKRREETGWGEMRLVDGLPEPFDRTPETDGLVRSGLYASGGSTLFDTALLRHFSTHTQSYGPFYWEDLDWGVQAWRGGLEVLFHPGSVAWHRHRATVARYYTANEIDRILARNRLLFRLRYLDAPRALADAGHCDADTVRELSSRTALAEIGHIRAAGRRAPFPRIEQHLQANRYYVRPPADMRPLVLVVSPFHILPPRHGGARRIWRLCEALNSRWRFMLLSDEGNAYDADSWEHVGPFESVHLVAGRPNAGRGRIERIRAHSHARLQDELDRLVAVRRPDLIQIEYVELAGLRLPTGAPSVLTAHDVLLKIDGNDEADHFERALLAKFSALIACSQEDAGLLAPLASHVVPNGTAVFKGMRPSLGNRNLLFTGPFRYLPNLDGLRVFLTRVFPELRRRFPGLEITILGGDGARQFAASGPLLRQPGVWVEDAVDDVRPWLERCALTINPLAATRGSSLKLIESLAAGRVCVSTRDGARGFADSALPGLLVADDIPAMLEPITRMLADEDARLALEQPELAKLQPFSWDSAAAKQEQIYRQLLRRTGAN